MSDRAEPESIDGLTDSTLAFPSFPSPVRRDGQRKACRKRNRHRIVLAVLIAACLLLLGAWALWPSRRNNRDLPHVVVKVYGMS